MFAELRRRMVEVQIAGRGIRDERVLQSMAETPRHAFVHPKLASEAYGDIPLPIGWGQTISQPYMVALMAECACLKPSHKVLEVGTGCGYAAAVIAPLVETVYTSEIEFELGKQAQLRLQSLGIRNVQVLLEDGSAGFPSLAPFDAIIVAAGAPAIPLSLQSQLCVGGIMIVPVGVDHSSEKLLRVTRTTQNKFTVEELGAVRFVPLRGKEGW